MEIYTKLKDLTDNSYYIIKETNNFHKTNLNELDKLLVCKKLDSIIDIIDYKISNNKIYILMDYYEHGDYFTFIEKFINFNKEYKNEIVSKLILQLAYPIRELHDNNFVHLDIKPENYLVRDIKNDVPELVLTDLGCLHRLTNNINNTLFEVGTEKYNSPEVKNNKYHKNSDVWNIGIITYVMLENEIPDENDIEKLLNEEKIFFLKI